MIVVFGPLSMDVHLQVGQLDGLEDNLAASSCHMLPGGKAAAQAIAAVKAGAKTSLIGKVGEDKYGAEIVETLRREGVIVSGIAATTMPTGFTVTVNDNNRARQNIAYPGANAQSSAAMIDKNFLNDKMLVLLQTGFDNAENMKVLSTARESGAMTMMNLAPYIDLSQKTMDMLDYLIVNQDEAKKLAAKLGLKVEKNALKIAQGLSQQGDLNCIITLGEKGCVGVTRDNTGWSVDALRVDDKILDRNGAEDSYCGTLAAGIQAGLPLSRAMKRACIAASLTCTRQGVLNAFPGKAEIDARMNDTKDPEQHKL